MRIDFQGLSRVARIRKQLIHLSLEIKQVEGSKAETIGGREPRNRHCYFSQKIAK